MVTRDYPAGFRRSEVLHGNGYFQFASGQGSLIEIYAAGTTGLEECVAGGQSNPGQSMDCCRGQRGRAGSLLGWPFALPNW